MQTSTPRIPQATTGDTSAPSTHAASNGHATTTSHAHQPAPITPTPRPLRRSGSVAASTLLFLSLIAGAAGLIAWKDAAAQESAALAASQPEPMEAIGAGVARAAEHRGSTTSIGTVLALRSITLRTELAGTVREARLVPGSIVEEGELLVSLDTSVEEAQLQAREARLELARTQLERLERASRSRGASESDVDRARAERDMAQAELAHLRAVLDKKAVRAPFRARVGMADVHPGQYLQEGATLTTLQGVDEAVHVDFTVAQAVAARLTAGDRLEVVTATGERLEAAVAAVDARVDPATRNALVRARVERGGPAPGSSVRVVVPVGEPVRAVAVPVSALRRGPAGDHVFVLRGDESGRARAHERRVRAGAVVGDEVLILQGLEPGEEVATAGSFKLREAVLVAAVPPADAAGESR